MWSNCEKLERRNIDLNVLSWTDADCLRLLVKLGVIEVHRDDIQRGWEISVRLVSEVNLVVDSISCEIL